MHADSGLMPGRTVLGIDAVLFCIETPLSSPGNETIKRVKVGESACAEEESLTEPMRCQVVLLADGESWSSPLFHPSWA